MSNLIEQAKKLAAYQAVDNHATVKTLLIYFSLCDNFSKWLRMVSSGLAVDQQWFTLLNDWLKK